MTTTLRTRFVPGDLRMQVDGAVGFADCIHCGLVGTPIRGEWVHLITGDDVCAVRSPRPIAHAHRAQNTGPYVSWRMEVKG